MKKLKITLLTLFLLSPLNVFAYSDKIIVGGENIGINIKSDGVLVVGFYKVDGNFIKSNPDIKEGDIIFKVGETEVNTINELTSEIENQIEDNKVELTIRRLDKEIDVTLELVEKDGSYKTGLYVKDSISGIGTLTYIDPETKIYGSLGHEIIEANTNTKVQIYFPFQYQGIPIVLCYRISSYPAVIQLSPEAITSDGVRISAIRDNTSPIYAVWVAIGNGSNALPE